MLFGVCLVVVRTALLLCVVNDGDCCCYLCSARVASVVDVCCPVVLLCVACFCFVVG